MIRNLLNLLKNKIKKKGFKITLFKIKFGGKKNGRTNTSRNINRGT